MLWVLGDTSRICVVCIRQNSEIDLLKRSFARKVTNSGKGKARSYEKRNKFLTFDIDSETELDSVYPISPMSFS